MITELVIAGLVFLVIILSYMFFNSLNSKVKEVLVRHLAVINFYTNMLILGLTVLIAAHW